MISKIPEKRKDDKSSFRSLIDYIAGEGYPPQQRRKVKTGHVTSGTDKHSNSEEKQHDAIYTSTRNTFCEKHWEIAEEMYSLGIMNTRCKDPVFHFILSFRPDEIPSNAQVDEAMDIALKELRLENCKAIYSLHKNETGLYHIHACVCRVDPETHLAITPGGGWAEKTLFKAARKIEVAQGWEILREDKYWDVTDDGKVVEKNRRRKNAPEQDEKPKLSPTAQDIEAHTGEKSAQTLAIEKGASILKTARSWQELHDKLSNVGLEFRKKGSGAVIVVNDVLVKASDIGRDCSLSSLEKRIGEFYERNNFYNNDAYAPDLASGAERKSNISLNDGAAIERNRRAHIQNPEPTDKVAANPETLSSWKKYQIYKTEYRERKDKRNAVFARLKDERESLKKSHKAERDALFKTNWKGRGAELNQQRRIVAAKQLQERLKLKTKHDGEKEELGAPTSKFLSYRKWLAENKPEHIKILRNSKGGGQKLTVKPEEITGIGGGDPEQPQHEQTQTTQAQPIGKISEGNLLNNMAFISEAEENEGEFTTIEHNVSIQGSNTDISAKQTKKKAEKILGIESYQLTKGKNGENAFGLHGEEIAFVERDKEIELFKHDESAVLAALQLANNKWRNGIKVEGNKEYLDLCMKLAEEHNLKIQVPKEYLKEREAELRKQKREQPEQLVAGQKPEVEDGSIDAYNYARQVALHKTKRVIDAIPEKSYKGEVVEKESGFILLKTGKDEIAIVSEKSLSLNSNLEIGDNVKLEKQRPNAARRDVAKLEQDRGR